MRAAWLPLAVLCVLGCSMMACAPVEGPELLGLTDLAPRVVSAGDRVDLRGRGFPEGRQAKVVFRGELRRPGSRPVRDVEITAAGIAHSSDHVVATLDDVVVSRFIGKGDGALHTTFAGDVRVLFPSRSPTAPAVVGTLRSVTVDFVPTEAGSTAREHEERGRRFLAHLGITVSSGEGREGFAVASVKPGGPADQAGVREGDVLLESSGLGIRGVGDLSVARGQETVTLSLARPGISRPYSVDVDVREFSPPAVAALAPGAVIVGVLVALFCLFMGPLPSTAAWLERSVARANRSVRGRRSLPSRLLLWLSDDRERGSGFTAPLLSFVLTVALFTRLGLGQSLVSEDVDLGVIVLSSVVVLSVGRLIEGGIRRGRSWSLLLGLRAVLATLVFVVPGLLGLAALAVATESVTLVDIVRAQGGSPWRFWALTNPGLCVAAACLLFSAVPTGVRRGAPLSVLEGATPDDRSGLLSRIARAAEWLHAWLTAGLTVALFLGAWKVPMASAVWEPSLGLSGFGMVLFVGKLWAIMIAVVAAKTLLCRLGVETLVGFAATRAVPLAVVAGGVAIVWAEASDRWELPPALAGTLLTGIFLAVAGLLLARLAAPAPRQALSGSVNPWL